MNTNEKHAIACEITKSLSVSKFPVKIGKLINDFKDSKGITLEDFSKKCNLPYNTVRRMYAGESVSEQLIYIVAIVMELSYAETEELNAEAFQNTHTAYSLLFHKRIDVDEWDDIIKIINQELNSQYKIDNVRPLHRKK